MATIRRAAMLTAASRPAHHVTAANILSPFLSQFQQCRQSSILSSLSDTRGAYSKRIRRGRGPASGKGKQAGRGAKGQKKHGKVPFGFNGGQTPDHIVHGKRGFDNVLAADLSPLNLSRLAKFISLGRIDPRQPITIRDLVRSRCLSGVKDGVKLLARQEDSSSSPLGDLKTPIQIVVSRASRAAIEAVESVGGSVVTRFYSPTSIRRVLRGESHPIYSLQSRPLPALAGVGDGGEVDAPGKVEAGEGEAQEEVDVREEMARYKHRLADATSRKDIEYYRDEAHRGYLSHLVGDGQGPSLYFKLPTRKLQEGKKKFGRGKKGPVKVDNRLF